MYYGTVNNISFLSQRSILIHDKHIFCRSQTNLSRN